MRFARVRLTATMSVIDESEESQSFIKAATENWGDFKRFAGERFVKIGVGVIATSEVDRQNERMAPEALYGMADQIQRESLWLTIEHDPLIFPAGRVLTARCFYAPVSRVHFVVGVFGYYDPAEYETFESAGLTVPEPVDVNVEIPTDEIELVVAYNPHEIPRSLIDEILSEAPPQVSREPQLVGRKSADPITILTILASFAAIAHTPFAKKFGERMGERAADELAAWLKNKVFTAFSRIEKEPLFAFESRELGCEVKFIVPSKKPLILQKAAETVDDAAIRALALLKILKFLGPEKLVYSFDIESLQWFPLYAATEKRGIIIEARALIFAERRTLRAVSTDTCS